MSGTLSANIPTLLTQYANYVSDTIVTETDFQDAAQCLSLVFDTLLNNSNTANLTEVWNFFVANQTGVAQQGVAFAGIDILNQADQTKYKLIYSLFMNAIDGIAPVVNAGLEPIVASSPTLITFLQNQAGSISPQSGSGTANQVTDALTESRLGSILTTLSNLTSSMASAAQDGVDGNSITPPSGGSGIRGWLSGIYQKVSGTLATSRTWTLTSGTDSITATINGTVPVSGSFYQTTQPISGNVSLAGSLPDTSGGALAALVAAQGVVGTGIVSPSGGSGIIGFLSGIYSKLTGTLTVGITGTVPVSGSFYLATQPVSGSVALSGTLPDTGSGSLASLVTAQGNNATGITLPSGGLGVLGWLSGIYKTLNTTVTTSDANNANYTHWSSLASGAAVPTQTRCVGFVVVGSTTATLYDATGANTMVLTLGDTQGDIITRPFIPTKVVLGTPANCTMYAIY